MIIVLKPRTTEENILRVENMVRARGLETHTVRGEELTIIGCIGDTVRVDPRLFEAVDAEIDRFDDIVYRELGAGVFAFRDPPDIIGNEFPYIGETLIHRSGI